MAHAWPIAALRLISHTKTGNSGPINKNADEKKSSGTEDFFISFDSAYYRG